MAGREDTVEVLVQGQNVHLAEYRTALLSYLERNGIFLCCEPIVMQDGLVLIQIRSNERQSASDSARLLTSQPNHNIENIVVLFSLVQQPQYSSRVAYLASSQETSSSSSAATTIARGTDGGIARGRGLGRGRGGVGRGMWGNTQVGNTNIQSHISPVPHRSAVRHPMSTMHSLPGHAVRLSYTNEGPSFSEEPHLPSVPFSLNSMSSQDVGATSLPAVLRNASAVGRKLLGGSVDCGSLERRVGESVFQSEFDKTHKPMMEDTSATDTFPSSDSSPTEGIDVITVKDLPQGATRQGLADAVKSAVKNANSNVTCEVKVVEWSNRSAKVHLSDMKAVTALWRVRHKPSPSIRYDDQALSWDLAVPEKYEEDRILVEGLPPEIDEDNLRMHLNDSDCILSIRSIDFTIVIQEDKSKAVINLDDTVADAHFVENLNTTSSFYEGTKSTHLTYHLIPSSRSLLVQGLNANVHKGGLRSYFNNISLEGMNRSPLIDDIEKRESGSAVVKLRTSEDCRAVMSLSAMPSIGQEGKRPTVSILSEYTCAAADSTVTDDKSIATSKVEETESVVNIPVEEVAVTNFIWNNSKYRRRLKSHLDCEDCDFDDSNLSISKPKLSVDELHKKFQEFTDRFLCKKLQILENSLWQKSVKFVRDELNARSGEVEIVEREEKLEIEFVGPEGEVTPFYHHCADRISSWRTEFEEANAEIKERISLLSLSHARILERTSFYQNTPEALMIKIESVGSQASVYLQGPRNLAISFKGEMMKIVESMTETQVTIDVKIANFLKFTGIDKLNALMEDSQVLALCINVDETFLRIVGFPEATSAATNLIRETYSCQRLRGMEDEEVQAFLRTDEYNQFVTSMIMDESVMVDPHYEEIKESAAPVTLIIVGETSAVQTSTKTLEDFLLNGVVFTDRVKLDHPGFAKYLTLHKDDDLNQLKARLREFKPEIDVRVREELVVVRSTKSGLDKLRDGIKRLVDTIESEEFEIKRHGLVRFLNSSAFRQERSQIEKKHKALLWMDGDEEEEEESIETGTISGRKFVASGGMTKLLMEYKVPNSGKVMALYTGDLCSHNVDVIVNAANEDLQHVGGLAKHIVDRTGKSVQDQCRRYIQEHGSLPTGDAMFTDSGRLTTTKYIIHTVGPKWPPKIRDTVARKKVEKLLQNAVSSSLELATNLNCKKVALPAISAGVFGCPSEIVAKNVVQSVTEYFNETTSTTITQVHVVLLDTDTQNVQCFKECMKKNLNPIAKVSPRENVDVVRAPQRDVLNSSETSWTKELVGTARSFSRPFQVFVNPGDITNEQTDVIVNSTNGDMNMRSALASKKISVKAGPGLQSECTDYVNDNGPLALGSVYTSGGYNLSCQHVIHVYCANSAQGLAKSVENCLTEANKVAAKSVSFPALGTGAMGMADDAAAKAMFDGIEMFAANGPSSVRQVNLVIYDKPRIPVFTREKMRREGEETDEGNVGVVTPAVGGVRFSNGTTLSVEQGDITSDASHVIVAPTGVVFSAVARKSPETNRDLSVRYQGQPNPVADLTAGGQLVCRRVYAISVPHRSRKASDDECIQTIQSVVSQCLNLANTAGYSSIAIPAIGTGGLGYNNKHTAAAVTEACKTFAAKNSAPNIKSVKISVFDAHRIGDFQSELQQRSLQKSGGFWQRMTSGVRAAVSSIFSSGQQPSKPKRTRKPLKSFSAGEANSVAFTVIADTRRTCKIVQQEVNGVVVRFCINSDEVIEKVPQSFEETELKGFAAKSEVALQFTVQDPKEGTAKLTLSGFTEDVAKVHTEVLRCLNKALRDDADTAVKEKIMGTVRWSWEDDDGAFKEYSPEVTVKLETALEEGDNVVKFDVKDITYEVDVSKMIQRGYGRKSRKVKREPRNQESSGELPSFWVDPNGGGHDYSLYKHKLAPTDPEFIKVSQAFTSTGGAGQITCIERIQNPKLYRSYIQEKQHIAKKRNKEIQLKTAFLELPGFHGTNTQAIEQIISAGFNRSFAGSAVGTRFGLGVYFARSASYSCGYCRAGLNNEKKMLYCDVLLGMVAVGNQSMVEPPIINSAVSVTDRYDSTVDNTTSPSIYVSCYRDNMAYPTHAITFV